MVASCILLLLSPLAAVVYSDPLVGRVAAALSICFLLEGLAQISASLLVRDLDFRALGLRDILEVVVMGVTSISMALFGYGAWSIVGGTLVSLVVRNVALHYARPFRPSWVFRLGAFALLYGFCIADGWDPVARVPENRIWIRLLSVRCLGPSAIGIYGMAKKLVSMPHESVTQIVNRAALSRFAKSQRDLPELASLYMRALGAIALLSLPMFAVLAVLSDQLVPLLLGRQWLTAIPLVRILTWVAAISTLSTVRHRLMVARAETRTLLKANIVRFGITSTVVILSVGYGLETLSWSLLLATVCSWLLENYICFKDWPALSVMMQLRRLASVIACTAICVAVGIGTRESLAVWFSSDLVLVVGTSVAMGLVYLLAVRNLNPILHYRMSPLWRRLGFDTFLVPRAVA